jgi:S-adenosylmethionine decarboxylase proenzyme
MQNPQTNNAQQSGCALGRQMTVEFYDCDAGILTDAGRMEQIFVSAAKRSGATVISSHFHSFMPQGVSGVVVISESHFAVHAWPEHEYAAVDLFTCGENVDFNCAAESIVNGKIVDPWGNPYKIRVKRRQKKAEAPPGGLRPGGVAAVATALLYQCRQDHCTDPMC